MSFKVVWYSWVDGRCETYEDDFVWVGVERTGVLSCGDGEGRVKNIRTWITFEEVK